MLTKKETMADIYGVKLKMRKEVKNMFNIYDSVVIKKTGKLGVIQGIMPRLIKSKGFKYYVVTQHGKTILQRKQNYSRKRVGEVTMNKILLLLALSLTLTSCNIINPNEERVNKLIFAKTYEKVE